MVEHAVVHVDIRGQLSREKAFSLWWVLEMQLGLSGMHSKHFYLLSCLAGPQQ